MSCVDLCSPRELAELTGWPERRIRSLLQKGALRHMRIGANYYLPRDAIEEFVKNGMVGPGQSTSASSTKKVEDSGAASKEQCAKDG